MKQTMLLLAVVVAALWGAPEVRAEDDKDPPSYTKDVKPFLTMYCTKCHMGDKPKGGVALDTYEGLTKNPKKKVVVVGKPTMSLLVLTMSNTGNKEMPPRKEKAQPTAAEIAKVKAWITAGAKDDSATGMLPLMRIDELLAAVGSDWVQVCRDMQSPGPCCLVGLEPSCLDVVADPFSSMPSSRRLVVAAGLH